MSDELKLFRLRSYAPTELKLAVTCGGNDWMEEPVHVHDSYEIMFVFRGCGTCTLNELTHPMVAGDVFLIDKHDRHSFRTFGDFYYFNVLFDPEIFSGLERESLEEIPPCREWFACHPARPRKLTLAPQLLPELRNLAVRVEKYLHLRQPGQLFVIRSAFMMFLANLFLYSGSGAASDNPRHAAVAARAVAFIRENCHQRLTLAKIAKAAGIGVSQLCVVFKQALGLPPGVYMQQARLDKARMLIEQCPELSLAEIAQRAGFYDSSAFCRSFCRRFDMSPKAYRKIGKS